MRIIRHQIDHLANGCLGQRRAIEFQYFLVHQRDASDTNLHSNVLATDDIWVMGYHEACRA